MLLAGTPGFYLEFEIPAGSEEAAERLENRQKHIELVAVRQAIGEFTGDGDRFCSGCRSRPFPQEG